MFELNSVLSKTKENLTPEDTTSFEKKARSWCQDFIEYYHVTNITPYIHAMMNHVPEFLKIHGSILPFTQQGLEKYNDITTKMYFRSTNHKGTQALQQIMQKKKPSRILERYWNYHSEVLRYHLFCLPSSRP